MRTKKTPEQKIYETEYKKIMQARKALLISPEQKDNLIALLDRLYKKFRASGIVKRRAKTRKV